ncbi:glycoprotein Xg isoform X2 [Herpailurus yagouaroundi]|uniref:glycoprotein Xg isoform X2 n=1 Tax=Herpailurus yagouaroundi TaxID=1608482 RepID=UPI001AD7622B|nr:glycoprotein Xg isoform X2 [Puma yagouaroundi]
MRVESRATGCRERADPHLTNTSALRGARRGLPFARRPLRGLASGRMGQSGAAKGQEPAPLPISPVCVTHTLCAPTGQRDFDLADALDDPEPTKKPSSGIYPRPRPPPRPQPGGSDSGGGYFGNRDQDDGRYPPRPRPPAAGGGGYYPNNDGHGNAYGGDGYSTYGNQQGNTIAKIVSPIVSVLVVMLVGAATGWFQRNRRRNCFRTREPEHV